ncbi:MAG: DISARM system helicase DrmA [Polyangiales bacterium]
MSESTSVRDALVDALQLDLVGPANRGPLATERLDKAPSRWYLTGFLVPVGAPSDAKHDEDESPDDLDGGAETAANNGGDNGDSEKQTPQRRFFPSSIGLSVLVPKDAEALTVTVSWGDYERATERTDNNRERALWLRTSREVHVDVPVTGGQRIELGGSRGLMLVVVDREVPSVDGCSLVPVGTRALSLFVVNEREVGEAPERRDESYAFQVGLEVVCEAGFEPRPDLHGHGSNDADEQIADLQYRDVHEFAVGHGVSPVATQVGGTCRRVSSTWIPTAYVHRVEAVGASELGVEERALQLDRLGDATAPATLRSALDPLLVAWRSFIDDAARTSGLTDDRRSVALGLCDDAHAASRRVEEGIRCLEDPVVFECFTAMNRAIAASMRQRDGRYAAKGAEGATPTWRPFQLAFILLNLSGIVAPSHPDRRRVDLLYFPTGGGKTEAYLGLAAFTLFLRRRRNPGRSGGGVGILMRYTLRLLTLDQLERATTLLCAMELQRRSYPDRWGEWPFEIGLWVGQAATPNRIGDPAAPAPGSAVDRLRQWQKDGGERPVPVERCPWCQSPLKRDKGADPFSITGTNTPAARLRVECVRKGAQPRGGACPFSKEGGATGVGPGVLPLCLTDEEVYRRLPAFVIATVDKFANLPWVGPSGMLLGKVTHATKHGYEGPGDASHKGDKVSVGPPDLIIQDELHLISGPLGTMVGLYETALDALMTRDGVAPKVVASTATVRRAEAQTRALFCREGTRVFPPPMPDRRALFFARTVVDERGARRYVGVAGQGRAHKVVMLRVYLALLSAAKKHWDAHGGPVEGNPADPYMTLLGYFNSLKELGNARRIVEDEVVSRVRAYGQRVRVADDPAHFVDRVLNYDVEELTSRESTVKVAQTKAALALAHCHKPTDGDLKPVDVALATNMISVGLDITRLGLMVVCGQPKATAEYIQASSRVGRDRSRPGLVVTLLNIHRPRDRSHYERFGVSHEAFYRAVEATSVTPFSPRALDRGLSAVTVTLARHGWPALAPADAVTAVEALRKDLDAIAETLDAREKQHVAGAVTPRAGARSKDVLDTWVKLVKSYQAHQKLQYGTELDRKRFMSLLRSPLEDAQAPFDRFRARRSLRDVEPKANVWVRSLGWQTDGEE